jgi:hypothetical protein
MTLKKSIWVLVLLALLFTIPANAQSEQSTSSDGPNWIEIGISVLLAFLAGVAGSYFFFRVQLESRLTKLEAALPQGKLEGYDTRLSGLERKAGDLEPIIGLMRKHGTDRAEEVFRRKET